MWKQYKKHHKCGSNEINVAATSPKNVEIKINMQDKHFVQMGTKRNKQVSNKIPMEVIKQTLR